MKKTFVIILFLIAIFTLGAVSAQNLTDEMDGIEISYGQTYGKVLTGQSQYDVYMYSVPEDCNVDEFRFYINNASIDWHGQDIDRGTEYRHFEGYYKYDFEKKDNTLKVEFQGNDKIPAYSRIIDFEASDSVIYIPDLVTKSVYYNRNAEIYLADNVTGEIVIDADGENYHTIKITDERSYVYPLDELSFGAHDIQIKVNDIIEKRTINVTYILDLELYDNEVLIATLPSDASKPLEIYIDGKRYSYTPDGISIRGVGNHTVRATYPGDSHYPKKTVTQVFEIEAQPKIYASKTVSMTYSAVKYAVFKTQAIKDGTVIHVSLAKSSKKVKVKNGQVSYRIPSLKPGKYTIEAKVDYLTWARTTLKIAHAVTLKTVKVKKSAKKLVLSAALKKVNGKYLKAKKIIFKFNGKKYAAKTNKKGVAKVTVKKAVLKKLKVGKKIAYTATYGKDTVKKTAKVKR